MQRSCLNCRESQGLIVLCQLRGCAQGRQFELKEHSVVVNCHQTTTNVFILTICLS